MTAISFRKGHAVWQMSKKQTHSSNTVGAKMHADRKRRRINRAQALENQLNDWE